MSDVVSPSASAPPDPLEAGREALSRHAWKEAFELLSQADRETTLAAADLESLALAAFFAARADMELEVKERAFQQHEVDGNTIRASYLAVDIARAYGYAGKHSIASAWRRRAERLIGPEGDTYVHGYLALVGSEAAAASGDLDAALTLAERAVAIGTAAADPDLRAYAQSNLGALKIASGATTDGFALMEEASIAAVNGELSPFTSGVTACRMIGACRDLTDYRRASEWIEATEKYCTRQSLEGFPGICRIHRAEVAAVGGAWDRAEIELVRATTELTAYNAAPPQADGYYAIGDIRRLKGDFDGAEAALREAHARGRTPQPALALVRLAQGHTRAAVKAITAAVADETWDRWARARLLPAQAEIEIAAGDVAAARVAVDELGTIVSGYPSPALEAASRVAHGRVLLAERDFPAAARELRLAIKGWREVGAPYEVARARALLSRALRALEDEDDADLELRAALDEFRRLGAQVDLDAAEREFREIGDRRIGPQTARRAFMFTDIVGSTNLAEALGDEAWERLLRWHDDTLRNLVERGGGQIVNSTGDGFFAAFDSAQSAVETARAIQRALRDHRESTGFAPSVRIGLHAAEATRRGADYSGMAVHVAARIGGLASGGEILASAETIAEAGDVATSGERTVSVKGATAPVTVAAVDWA
ncbi:MAG TPA: adenylate/guanylate cyclase domain-containing protein [Candidatus Limnocylindrales bacterium]|nr:adenylate/guanylate cyclase domain-containing protein [Candidatus Limnocylindrales bacterium]